VIFRDYSNPEVIVRTNIDITATKIIELTWFDRLRRSTNRLARAGLTLVGPGVAYARRISWDCFRDAALGVGALINLVYQSANLVAAASVIGATGGAAAPWLGGATYSYLGAIGGVSLFGTQAFVTCFGDGGSGHKRVVAKT
jgi:hypothetical protein